MSSNGKEVKIMKRIRIIDTFATRNVQYPKSRSMDKDIKRYSLELEYGLELRRRKCDKN